MVAKDREDRREHGCRTVGIGLAADPSGVDCLAGTCERPVAATCGSPAASGAADTAAASGQFRKLHSQATRVHMCGHSGPVVTGLKYAVRCEEVSPVVSLTRRARL